MTIAFKGEAAANPIQRVVAALGKTLPEGDISVGRGRAFEISGIKTEWPGYSMVTESVGSQQQPQQEQKDELQ